MKSLICSGLGMVVCIISSCLSFNQALAQVPPENEGGAPTLHGVEAYSGVSPIEVRFPRDMVPAGEVGECGRKRHR